MESDIFIKGERIDLRTVEKEAIPFLKRNINDPKVRKDLGQHKPYNRKKEEDFIENIANGKDDQIHLLITDSEDEERIGMVSLFKVNKNSGNAEIGLWITPEHQEEGFGTESTELIVQYGFDELRMHRLHAKVFDDNPRSINIWEKLNFKKEGVMREASFKNGKYVNVLIYGLLKKEWKS
ncbi:MAG: GNAT family N-acetyltransferase [Thermoplasmatota archaeon]